MNDILHYIQHCAFALALLFWCVWFLDPWLLQPTYSYAADLLIRFAERRPYWHLPGYMERYWVVKYSRWFPWSARINRILRSDNDRHYHDHPWPFISVILRGGYWEHMPLDEGQNGRWDESFSYKVWRGPGHVIVHRATDRHRLELPEGRECVTLFLMGRYVNEWGFYTEIGKVNRRRYYAFQAIEKWFSGIAYYRAIRNRELLVYQDYAPGKKIFGPGTFHLYKDGCETFVGNVKGFKIQ